MFKLQRLEITGFKSFADYTEIVFTGNGITAVVGPNGCGKSNVSDSISWVLGEQRAKSLRGGEMKDVVFQGSKNRKPSGMAEVILHLVRDEDALGQDEPELEQIDEALAEIDEHAVDMQAIDPDPEETASEEMSADGSAELSIVAEGNGFVPEPMAAETALAAQVGSVRPIESKIKTKRHWRPRSFALDFAPGEAISVARRLYLSGESEYQLNGKTCRLRDIQDLFAGTGLSGSHYAIIEQGRIGQILSAKPGDRRSLIEEAAGISKFRTRQRAAESRLVSAKGNLSRISDIVSEVEKQANSLRRHAAKTRRYKILQEEFRVLLRQLFAAEGRHFTALAENLARQLDEAVKMEASLAYEVSAKEEAFRVATQAARTAEAELAELRGLHSQNALERDRAEREHRYQNEQIQNLTLRLESIRTEIENTEKRLEFLSSEYKKLEKDDAREREEAGQAELAFRSAEEVYRAKLGDVGKIESEREAIRTELLQHTAAIERFDEIGRQLDSNIEKLNERIEGLKRESARAIETHGEHQKEAERLAADLVEEHAKLEGYQKEKASIAAAANAARETLRLSEAELRTLKDEYMGKQHRLDTLLELEEKRAVYTPSVQKLFAAQEKIGVKFAGVLADQLNVSDSAEKAVESLFGNYLQAVLVEGSDDMTKVRDWLRTNDVGRIAILELPKGTNGRAEKLDNPNTIADAMGVSGEVRQILNDIFPREMSAGIVESISGSAENKGGTLIDNAGDILFGGRLFLSGRSAANEKNTSLLAFKRELQQLEKSTTKLRSSIERSEAAVLADRVALSELEEKTVDVQSLIIKVERGLITLEMREKSARQEIERSERHRKVVAEEITQIESEIVEMRSRKEDASSRARVAREERVAAEEKLNEISIVLNDARHAADLENNTLTEKRMVAATSSERRRSVQSALRRIENEEKELQSRLAVQNIEITENEEKIKTLKASVAEIASRIESAAAEIEKEGVSAAAAAASVESARTAADALSGELTDLNKRSAEARNERAAIEIRQAETVTRLRNISENCSHELNIPIVKLVDSEHLDDDFDLEAARSTTEDLRQKLDNFGEINMLAVEELAEAEERLLFLTSQRQDIIDSIAATEEALREIKERSRERFKIAFEAINANFVEFFSDLFGGGRGEMTLLESEDILEAGIEVVAQPPGKRLQNILLLSGGEKAMTAIALILAIFKYRPSPFCLLDEVDAPLDEANVGRFVNKISEMSEKTQFIVITHNKRTMEAARALYGVTMQEAGVSKVVSVKFD